MPIAAVWTALRDRFRAVRTPEQRHRIYAQVTESSTPRGAFYLLVVLSTTIAAFGLLTNSTAVVIGAMLVAPLMGPIFGIALGLAAGSRRLLGRAAASELAGVVLCVALSALIGMLAVYSGFGPEVLSRTRPTVYDIIVAIASGLAGAYALVDEKVSPALPGVAIATALVPPLTTCGLCLSAGRWDWAAGAFLLFFSNLVAIELAAAFVFLLAGMGRAGAGEQFGVRLLLRRFGVSLALLVAVAVFMTHTLVALASERKFSERLEAMIAAEVRSSAGARLSQVEYHRNQGRTDVVAVVLTPQEFNPGQVALIERKLRASLDPACSLVIRSLLSKDASGDGPVFVTPEERRRRADAIEQTQFLARLSQTMTAELAAIPGAQLVDLRQQKTEEQTRVAAVVRAPAAVEPAQVARLEAALQAQAPSPVRLTVRTVLTRDADAKGYLYVPEGERPPTDDERNFAQRLAAVLREELHRQNRRAVLVDHRFERRAERLLVFATVRAPALLAAKQVARMETGLRKTIDPKTDLVVRATVGADIGPRGQVRTPDNG